MTTDTDTGFDPSAFITAIGGTFDSEGDRAVFGLPARCAIVIPRTSLGLIEAMMSPLLANSGVDASEISGSLESARSFTLRIEPTADCDLPAIITITLT